MWLRSILTALRAIPPLPRALTAGLPVRRHRFHPALETLDDRALPSFVVMAPFEPNDPTDPTDPNFDVGSNPQSLVVADLNADGKLDLVSANAGDGTVSVLLGNSTGFGAATDFAAGSGPHSLAVGDFNADGKFDLVAANTDGTVNVLLGTGTGSFGAPAATALESAGGVITPHALAVGDFNRDGKMDVAVTSNTVQTYEYYDPYYGYWYTYTTNEGHVRVLVGNNAGGFTTQNTYALGSRNPGGLAVADISGDGKLDVVTANEWTSSVSVLIGTGDGTLAAPVDYLTGWAPKAVAVGYFTSDANYDLITVGQTVDVLPGLGNGTFQPAREQPVDPVAVVTGDFNADGKLDAVALDPATGVVALLGRGDGTFTLPIAYPAGTAPSAVVAGDFNADGKLDVAVTNGGSDDLSVFLNDGEWPELNAPAVSIGNATVSEGNTGTTNATFTVSLSAAYTRDVTVRYTTGEGYYWSPAIAGTDYQATSGTVTIPAGQTSATITVPIIGDRLGEADEFFTVKLSNATDAFIATGVGYGTITDDEPRVSIDYGPYVTEGHLGTKTVNVTVRLSAAYDEEVRVNYSTAEGDTQWYDSGYWGWYGWYAGPPQPAAATAGTDFQSNSGTLVFAAGQTEKVISVVVNGDRLAESDEAFSIDLDSVVGGILAVNHSVVTIVDDEPWISISGASVVEGTGGTKMANFTVTLSAASDDPITVAYADGYSWYGYGATAGTDYEATSGTLTFAKGQTSKTISVKIFGDNVAEYEEYFSLNLSNATGAHLSYSSSATGTIVDDDPHMTVSNVSVTEGNSGSKTVTFTVRLSAPPTGTVTVRYATEDGSARAGSDYKAASGTLTFAAGVTSKTVSVTIYGDTSKEYDEYFYLNLYNPTGNILIDNGWAEATIRNDDTKKR